MSMSCFRKVTPWTFRARLDRLHRVKGLLQLADIALEFDKAARADGRAVPGSAGLPRGRKVSSTSHTNSTKAALLLPLGFSGESPGAGQMRCRSSRTSKEGMQSMASCICKKSKLFLSGFFSVIDNMAMFHQAVMTLARFS